jgi:hypothetical protein
MCSIRFASSVNLLEMLDIVHSCTEFLQKNAHPCGDSAFRKLHLPDIGLREVYTLCQADLVRWGRDSSGCANDVEVKSACDGIDETAPADTPRRRMITDDVDIELTIADPHA